MKRFELECGGFVEVYDFRVVYHQIITEDEFDKEIIANSVEIHNTGTVDAKIISGGKRSLPAGAIRSYGATTDLNRICQIFDFEFEDAPGTKSIEITTFHANGVIGIDKA